MNTKTCSIDGCNDGVRARGWCTSHYNRWHASGSPVAKTTPTTACKLCGKPTPTKGATGPRPTYCSPTCRAEAQRTYQREYARAQREAERTTRTPRACAWCSEELPQGTHGQTRYHAHCARAHKATYAKDSTTRQCAEHDCDRPVRARTMCAMHWKRWARAQGLVKAEPWDDRRKNNYHIRRARKHGTTKGEVITIDMLMHRDNNTCNICDEHIDPHIEYPNPMSKSIDHVVALSRGGEHTMANTAPSHLVCNVRKNDKDIDEVRAIG